MVRTSSDEHRIPRLNVESAIVVLVGPVWYARVNHTRINHRHPFRRGRGPLLDARTV